MPPALTRLRDALVATHRPGGIVRPERLAEASGLDWQDVHAGICLMLDLECLQGLDGDLWVWPRAKVNWLRPLTDPVAMTCYRNLEALDALPGCADDAPVVYTEPFALPA